MCKGISGLISNADKFMLQEGQITVTVVVEDKVIRISVADKGIGIQPDEQSQVFSKLFHANLPVELRHLQGVGASLYIFKHAVVGMGGTIGFESEPGKGSTFWFTLPIAESDVQATT
jgi:signal transduction histidine kinase